MASQVVPFPSTKFRIVRDASKFVPVVDGVVVNYDTGQIIPVTGFIQVSPTIVLDPVRYQPVPIGETFFFTAEQAAKWLLPRFQRAVLGMKQKIEELEAQSGNRIEL